MFVILIPSAGLQKTIGKPPEVGKQADWTYPTSGGGLKVTTIDPGHGGCESSNDDFLCDYPKHHTASASSLLWGSRCSSPCRILFHVPPAASVFCGRPTTARSRSIHLGPYLSFGARSWHCLLDSGFNPERQVVNFPILYVPVYRNDLSI
jgi:hypothetical protein